MKKWAIVTLDGEVQNKFSINDFEDAFECFVYQVENSHDMPAELKVIEVEECNQ